MTTALIRWERKLQSGTQTQRRMWLKRKLPTCQNGVEFLIPLRSCHLMLCFSLWELAFGQHFVSTWVSVFVYLSEATRNTRKSNICVLSETDHFFWSCYVKAASWKVCDPIQTIGISWFSGFCQGQPLTNSVLITCVSVSVYLSEAPPVIWLKVLSSHASLVFVRAGLRPTLF